MIISGLQGQVESSWLQAEKGGGGCGIPDGWVSSRKIRLGDSSACLADSATRPGPPPPRGPGHPTPTAPAKGVTPQQVVPTVPGESNWTRAEELPAAVLCHLLWVAREGGRCPAGPLGQRMLPFRATGVESQEGRPSGTHGQAHP